VSLLPLSSAMPAVTSEALVELFLTQGILENDEPLEPTTDLFAAGMDSMAMMQLVIHVEDHFGIALQPAEMTREHFTTVQTLASFLQKKQAA
jgi:acyl carrier protein